MLARPFTQRRGNQGTVETTRATEKPVARKRCVETVGREVPPLLQRSVDSLSEGFLSSGFFSAGFLSSGFFSSGVLSGGLVSTGFLSGGLVSTGFLSGGLVSTGFLSGGLVSTGFLS